IDWVGHRYYHGDDLRRCLWVESQQDGEERDWDDPVDITFLIPEHVAWHIHNMAEECGYNWDCFAPELAGKLTDFCQGII
ncbi:hypothetical protein ABTH81_20720, partial [Acinetobacter baumannii]